MDRSEHYRHTFTDIGITVVVRYVGIHPLGKVHEWETQIIGLEKVPKAFYKPIDHKKPTLAEVAFYIAKWYKDPYH